MTSETKNLNDLNKILKEIDRRLSFIQLRRENLSQRKYTATHIAMSDSAIDELHNIRALVVELMEKRIKDGLDAIAYSSEHLVDSRARYTPDVSSVHDFS